MPQLGPSGGLMDQDSTFTLPPYGPNGELMDQNPTPRPYTEKQSLLRDANSLMGAVWISKRAMGARLQEGLMGASLGAGAGALYGGATNDKDKKQGVGRTLGMGLMGAGLGAGASAGAGALADHFGNSKLRGGLPVANKELAAVGKPQLQVDPMTWWQQLAGKERNLSAIPTAE